MSTFLLVIFYIIFPIFLMILINSIIKDYDYIKKMKRYITNIKSLLEVLFIPTYVLAKIKEKEIESINTDLIKIKQEKKLLKIQLNKENFNSSIRIFILVFIIDIYLVLEKNIDLFRIVKNSYISWIAIVLCSLALILLFSRCLEIFLAFGKDAIDKLQEEKDSHNTSLKYYERIKLAMRSYIELVLNYALIYYILTKISIYSVDIPAFFNEDMVTLIDSLYFSSITITTLGYGDILATNWLTKLLSSIEVFNGMILVIVSFTIYVSKSISENESKKSINEINTSVDKSK